MALTMSTNFSPEVVSSIFSKVNGHSALARLSAQTPIAFTGNDVFVFSLDDEVNMVAEGGQKTAGASAAAPVKIVPFKVEYGSRVTDEFMFAAEEKQLDILSAFMDGYARKIARGLDIMAFHGVNPRDGVLSDAIGTKSFDTNTGVAVIPYGTNDTTNFDLLKLQAAVDAVGDTDITGYALSKAFATGLSLCSVGNTTPFAPFMLGANPGSLNGTPADVNSTVSFSHDNLAYVGDFANAFKWGYAKQIPIEVIPYGDPDGNGDLKRTNQVFIRAEAWIGWGILNPGAFARIARPITLDKSTASVAAGSTVTLTASTNPLGGTVTWSTSAASKATVSNGVVTGVAAGDATITATYGGYTATCAVTVTAA